MALPVSQVCLFPSAGEISQAGMALEVVKSRAFTEKFIKKYDILPELLAVNRWNPGTRELEIDPELFNEKTNEWQRKVSPPRSKTPSNQEAYKSFSAALSVNQDIKSNLITISVKHQSPDVAQRWVELLVYEVNEAMRQKEIREAEESIEYLKQQASETSLADLDQVFYELMQGQM